MRTVIGLFERPQDASNAVNALRSFGISDNSISVVARDASNRMRQVSGEPVKDAVEPEAFALGGAALGGVAGLIAGLGALGALVIPGIGPVIAVGTLGGALAGTAVGAGVGAAAGGLIGALTNAGVAEGDAHVYAEGVRRGGVLLTAQVEDQQVNQAEQILRQNNAVDVSRQRNEWERNGWDSFNPNSDPDSYEQEWRESSKAGTATGTATGAATGAVIGSAGGPVGTAVGGLIGAATGAATGAAGDVAGEKAEDRKRREEGRPV